MNALTKWSYSGRLALLVAEAWLLVVACGARRVARAHEEGLTVQWRHGGARGASFSPEGTRVLAAGERHAVVLDAATGRALTPPLRHEDRLYAAVFAPDGRRVVTAGADDAARIWDAASGEELARLTHAGSVYAAAFGPDGRGVVTAGEDKTARVWDAATGNEVLLIPHDAAVWSAAFSPDGAKILTVARDAAFVWDAGTGERLLDPLRTGQVLCAAFSPDGTKVVTGEEGGFRNVARVWDARTGKMLTETGRHWGRITSVACSPDGGAIAVAADGEARVWDAATGQPLTKPLGDRTSRMHVAAFSPDGTRLLGAGEGAQAVVWDIAAGREVARAQGHDADLSAAFHPTDGSRFLTGGNQVALDADPDPGICLWQIPPAPPR